MNTVFLHLLQWWILLLLSTSILASSPSPDNNLGVSFVKPSTKNYLRFHYISTQQYGKISFQFKTAEKSLALILSLRSEEGRITDDIQIAGNGTHIVAFGFFEGDIPFTLYVECGANNQWHQVILTSQNISCDEKRNSFSREIKVPTSNSQAVIQLGYVESLLSDPQAIRKQYFGCVRELLINEEIMNLQNNVSSHIKAGCLSTCSNSRCYRHGQCIEKYDGNANCDCFSSLYLGPNCLQARGYDFNEGIARKMFDRIPFEGIKFMYAPFVHLADISRVNGSEKQYVIVMKDALNRQIGIYHKGYTFGVEFEAASTIVFTDLFKNDQITRSSYLKDRYIHVRIGLRFQVSRSDASSTHHYTRDILNDDGEVIVSEALEGHRETTLPHEFNEADFFLKDIIVGSTNFSGCIQNLQLKLRGKLDVSYVDFDSPGWLMDGNINNDTSQCKTFPSPLPTTWILTSSTMAAPYVINTTLTDTMSLENGTNTITDVTFMTASIYLPIYISCAVLSVCLLVIIIFVVFCQKLRHNSRSNKDFIQVNGHQKDFNSFMSESTPSIPLPYKPAYWSASLVSGRESTDAGHHDSMKRLMFDDSDSRRPSASPNEDQIRRSLLRMRYCPHMNGSLASAYSVSGHNGLNVDSTLSRFPRGDSLRAPIAKEIF